MALAMLPIEHGRAAASAALVRTTVDAALSFAHCGTAAVSAQVLSAAAGTLKAAALTKLQVTIVICLAVTVAGLASAGIATTAGQGKDGLTTFAPGMIQIGRDQDQAPAPASIDKFGDPLPPGVIARLGTMRLRVTPAASMAVSPDGKTLFTAEASTLGRLDAASGRLHSEVHLPVANVEFNWPGNNWFSADGTILAIRELDGIGLWDVTRQVRIRTLQVDALRVVFGPGCKIVATTEGRRTKAKDSECKIGLWDLATGKGSVLCTLPAPAADVAFSPDGKRLFALVTDVTDQSLACWDVATGNQLWQTRHLASHLAISPDGQTICTAAGHIRMIQEVDGKSTSHSKAVLDFWNAHTGAKLVDVESLRSYPCHLAFSPDGKKVALGTWTEAQLWDVASMKLERRIATASRHVAFAPDGKSLYTLGNMLLRWDLASGKLLYDDLRDQGHVGPVGSLAFAPDSRSIVSAGEDETLRVWNLDKLTHRVLATEAKAGRFQTRGGRYTITGAAGPLFFTPDGQYLFSDGTNATVDMIEVATGNVVRTFNLPQPNNSLSVLRATRLTDDGRTLLALANWQLITRPAAEDEPLRGWDVNTGKEVLSKTLTSYGQSCTEFSPDGRVLVKRYRGFQSLKSGGELKFAPPCDAADAFSFSPDSRLLAATVRGKDFEPAREMRIYEVLTGRQVALIQGPLGYSHTPVFGPDSRVLALAGSDALNIWDAVSGELLTRLPVKGQLPHWTAEGFASSVAFAPDGKSIATGHSNGTVLIWDCAPVFRVQAPPNASVNVAGCWAALAELDAAGAFAALRQLAAVPDKTLPLLRQEIRPIKPMEPEWIATRLSDLNSTTFSIREAAQRELIKVASIVEADLKRAAEMPPSLEVRDRIAAILETLNKSLATPPSPAELRSLRALTLLERIGSREAKQLLTDLAGGAPGARLTEDAKSALRRLK
jgi:WD40 repeat protein